MSCQRIRTAVAFALVSSCAASSVDADEGMWLLSSPPMKLLKDRHNFEPTPEWFEHIQKSCVRCGASGSIVSSDGLVMTNHHVGAGQLRRLSTAERNLYRDGFYARTREEELRCPTFEMLVLWSTEEVTDRVNAAVTPSMSTAEANTAREKRIAEITNLS